MRYKSSTSDFCQLGFQLLITGQFSLARWYATSGAQQEETPALLVSSSSKPERLFVVFRACSACGLHPRLSSLFWTSCRTLSWTRTLMSCRFCSSVSTTPFTLSVDFFLSTSMSFVVWGSCPINTFNGWGLGPLLYVKVELFALSYNLLLFFSCLYSTSLKSVLRSSQHFCNHCRLLKKPPSPTCGKLSKLSAL